MLGAPLGGGAHAARAAAGWGAPAAMGGEAAAHPGRQDTRDPTNRPPPCPTAPQIGDAEVEYDPNFRLYLQTKLSNPHYKPEIAAQTTLVNFCVTEKGLEDQLLALVVDHERPDLQDQALQLVRGRGWWGCWWGAWVLFTFKLVGCPGFQGQALQLASRVSGASRALGLLSFCRTRRRRWWGGEGFWGAQ